jgi:hypothetical protein
MGITGPVGGGWTDEAGGDAGCADEVGGGAGWEAGNCARQGDCPNHAQRKPTHKPGFPRIAFIEGAPFFV